MSCTVAKLGGSVFSGVYLDDWLNVISQFAQTQNIIIVPGGGVYAENIRKLQMTIGVNDITAHRQALLAMSQSACLLQERCPALKLLAHSSEFLAESDNSLPLLWEPNELLYDESAVPANWDFTSDSIALWLAQKLDAKALVLIKARNLNRVKKDIQFLSENDYIDKGLQLLGNSKSIKIVYFDETQFELLIKTSDWSQYQLQSNS